MDPRIHPDRLAYIQDTTGAPDKPTETKAKRKGTPDRKSPYKFNYKTYSNRQLLVNHNSSRYSSNISKVNKGYKKNNHTRYSTSYPADARFSGHRSLAEWRQRHDELAAYIKKTKENIARRLKTMEELLRYEAQEKKTKVNTETDIARMR